MSTLRKLIHIYLIVFLSAMYGVKSIAQVAGNDIILHANHAQSGVDSSINKAQANLSSLPNKWLAKLKGKYSGVNKNMAKENARMLKRMNKQELTLQKKLATKDSVAAKAEYASFQKKYARIKRLMADTSLGKTKNISTLNTYLPGMDSLQTSMKFLKEIEVRNQESGGIQNFNKEIGDRNKEIRVIPSTGSLPNTSQYTNQLNLSPDKQANIGGINTEMQGIQKQMQISQELNKLADERKQELKGLVSKYGMDNQVLMPYKKQAYYYKQQMNDYKATITDPDKIQDKIIGLVKDQQGFNTFMAKNSLLSQLFPSTDAGLGSAALNTGLQTRTGLQQQLTQQIGGASNMGSAQGLMDQQMQVAQGQLNQLKDKLSQQGGNSNSADMPDFKPNSQKTKSFLKRIEYGFNIQSQRPNGLLPVTSDMAATGGYKFNDHLVAGFGLSYKLGWGSSWNHIQFSNQGVGFRTYIDMQLKKTYWLTGGWEQNYYPQLQNALTNNTMTHNSSWGNGWQESGLVGLTKKYKIGKKQCKMQLLWDFLSYSQMPGTPRLVYRVGYNF